MSWQAFEAVRDFSDARGATRTVALVLASYGDEAGENVFPGLRTICGKAKVTRKTAVDARRWLIENGKVELRGHRRSGTPMLSFAPLIEKWRGSLSEPPDEPPVRSANGRGSLPPNPGSASAPEPEKKRPTETGSPKPSGRAGAREGSNGEGHQHPAGERGEGQPEASAVDERDGLAGHVRSILQGGVDSLQENDHGRPWPSPKRADIARILAELNPDPDLAERAAREAREIVQSQDRAPNIAGLYAQQLEKAKRADVRQQIADSLEAAR
jgi:hypothetical protein